MSEHIEAAGRSVDEERQKFGSAGWDAVDDESGDSSSDNTGSTDDGADTTADVPKPDPDKDQG